MYPLTREISSHPALFTRFFVYHIFINVYKIWSAIIFTIQDDTIGQLNCTNVLF